MKSLQSLVILWCILLGAIGSPVSINNHINGKRGLEVKGNEIILVNTNTGATKKIATVSEDNQKWITKHTEKMKKRNIPFISAVTAYYDYMPLGDGNKPETIAEIHFWPPKADDKKQQEIMKKKLDAAKVAFKKTDAYKNLKKYIEELMKTTGVTKIVGLGCGSLNDFNPFSEKIQEEHHARSYIQLAVLLTMQEEINSGPEVILQDPTYGENEINFMTKYSSNGGIKVLNDPDAFDTIDRKTIFFNIGGYDGFWYRVNEGPTPVAIISGALNVPVECMMKPQAELIAKYTKPQQVAPVGTEGLSIQEPTIFWTRASK
ncbi:hypothetical protein N7495_010023 [Penicillium taxi]|uniref:uncharacterized protein n=1 Tax=Penicillium taxi TaxID=168475 RepID=UPI002544D890|nr:uncharacterized protein N7495_010023 [Penicillium taxi]KAJ5885513.1 hypothetical protein N7495_010023 [Penicillium taxi]